MRKIIILFLLLLVTTAGAYTGIKPPLGRLMDWSNPLSKGPVGLWLMKEGSGNIVQDLSGNNNNGTLVADAAWGTCIYGKEIVFDGSDSCVTIANNSLLSISTKWSVIIWFRSNDLTTDQMTLFASVHPDADHRFVIGTPNANNTIGVGYYDGSWHAKSTGLTDNNYHCVAMTFDASALNGYLDGALMTGNQATYCNNTKGVYFGIDNDGTGDWSGGISSAVIFNRDLSASEIALLYREPFCMLKSPFDLLLYGGISEAVTAGQVIIINMN